MAPQLQVQRSRKVSAKKGGPPRVPSWVRWFIVVFVSGGAIIGFVLAIISPSLGTIVISPAVATIAILLGLIQAVPVLFPEKKPIGSVEEAATYGRDHQSAQTTLQGKIATQDFDVFLCYNERDRAAVRQLGEQLKQMGILPWLDEWELRPGLPWQRTLEEQIIKIKAAAVCVGKSGLGPWQQQELDAFLREFVGRGCPVIPVLLSDAPQQPTLPVFLKGMMWVDLRVKEPDPMQRLVWGITGRRV